ncbi:hypothetical protein [Planctomicrobium piriforme]|uniref:Rod shape-determining protein MreD n=1 Tax=Planctomicrobium piriforme TaxID=1576369 RepID=A0A1I3B2Y0_9PLAN|nr:hypothetical protein [Planctomicrobium piriforme]SFH56540.1 hypothetical protein SAMN05421753_101195 [Planctomicrobium piriforme]
MLQRSLLAGLLVSVALLCDLGLPVWTSTLLLLPSGLDLALLVFCQWLSGGERVFWAGLTGLLHDDVLGHPVGPELITAATLGLIVGWGLNAAATRRSLIDRALQSAGILVMLGIARIGFQLIGGTTADWTQLVTTHVSRLAATFLLLVIGQLVLAAATGLSMRNRRFQEFHA